MDLLDLPIYRTSLEKHDSDVETKVSNDLKRLENNTYRKAEWSEFPEKKKRRELEEKSQYNPWEFNQIIGFLRLRFWNTQVRATLYKMSKERYSLRFKKEKFIVKDSEILISGINILTSATSDEIFAEVHNGLKGYAKEISPRFLDLSQFELIWKYMNWKAIYEHYQMERR